MRFRLKKNKLLGLRSFPPQRHAVQEAFHCLITAKHRKTGLSRARSVPEKIFAPGFKAKNFSGIYP